MSTEAITPEVTPEPEVPVAPQVFKARREIQITDDSGNTLGPPQVYEAEGATQAEADQKVADKMAQSIEHGTRRMMEFRLLRKNGGIEAPTIPEGADVEDYVDFTPKPRQLSDAEKFQLAQDLRDPAKFEEAYDKLYEARTGLKPADEVKLKQKQNDRLIVESAAAAAEAFSRDNPEFYGTEKNKKAMLDYMVARDAVLRKDGKTFPWTKKNLEIAFRELKADGLLAEKPKPVVVETPPPPPEPPRTEAPEPVVEARKPDRFPSAIKPSSASGAEQKPKPKGPSAKDVAMMNPDQYKAYLESQGLWGK